MTYQPFVATYPARVDRRFPSWRRLMVTRLTGQPVLRCGDRPSVRLRRSRRPEKGLASRSRLLALEHVGRQCDCGVLALRWGSGVAGRRDRWVGMRAARRAAKFLSVSFDAALGEVEPLHLVFAVDPHATG